MGMRIRPFITGYIGTNSWLVWDEDSRESTLFDPGEFSADIKNAIEENGLMLKYIALTHGHNDHIEGVPGAKESFPEAKVAAGKGDAEMMRNRDSDLPAGFAGANSPIEPDIFLEDGDMLELGNLSFEIIETPGHTPGGLSFYIPEYDEALIKEPFSGMVFSGDTLFRSSIGRTDLQGGNLQALMLSIKNKLFTLPDDTIVMPGHMDVTTIEYEKRYNPFII